MNELKIIVTTSDYYLHVVPVFCHLFNRYWGAQAELVGYLPPKDLPDNIKFHSLGTQRGPQYFSDDLAAYFREQDDFFIWLMEDTFLKAPVDIHKLRLLQSLCMPDAGRINLTGETIRQDHRFYARVNDFPIYENTQTANYRLSTQPSIWNKEFLLRYLTPGLTPWLFEKQKSVNDGYRILGPGRDAPVRHNEGVRKFDIHRFNLSGIDPQVIREMRNKKLIE